jgi:hypothetical protein
VAPVWHCPCSYLIAVATAEGLPLSANSVPPHRAFFEALGTLPEGSPDWRAALAGLVTLRYLDAWADTGAAASDLVTERRAVESAIEVLPANAPERIYLAGLVDASTIDRSRDLTRVVSLLLGYGRALQRRGSWALAVDVFMRAYRACAGVLEQPVQRELAAAAALRAGRSYCELNDPGAAACMYEVALTLGRDSGDEYAVLRARTAMACLGVAPGHGRDHALDSHRNAAVASDRPVELPRAFEPTLESPARAEAEMASRDQTDAASNCL